MRTAASKYRLFLIVATAICNVGRPLVAQQTSSEQREVKNAALNLYAPVQVTAVNDLARAYIVPRGPNQIVTFQDSSPNWVENVSLTVENHSTKDIVAIEVMVFIPTWETDIHHMQHFIRFHEGQFPAYALHLRNGTVLPEESMQTFNVKPQASVNVPLKQAFAKLSEQKPALAAALDSVNSINVQIDRLFFADGTAWQGNTYLKPDPSSPGNYTPLTKEAWEYYDSADGRR